jgi:4-hydroxybenzoate polyprenyltransferase
MSVITSKNATRKRYALLALALLLLLVGGVGLYFGSHNFPIRALGLAAIMASTYFVRISRVRDRSGLPEASGRGTDLKTAKGPGRLLWIVSLVLVPMLGAAFFLMHIDFVNGGHEAWPVYVFAGVGLACAIVWGCLAALLAGGTAKNSQN